MPKKKESDAYAIFNGCLWNRNSMLIEFQFLASVFFALYNRLTINSIQKSLHMGKKGYTSCCFFLFFGIKKGIFNRGMQKQRIGYFILYSEIERQTVGRHVFG